MSQQITRDELIADFRRVADELGKRPTLSEYNDHGEYSSTPIYEQFESFGELKDEAGFQTGERKIPDETLLSDLRRVAETIGRSPPVEVYDEQGNHNSKTLKHRFGNWNAVLQEAGLEPTNHSEHWSDVDPTGYKRYGTVTVECANCGAELERKPFEVDQYNRFYCGHECKGVYMSQQRGEEARSWDGGKVQIPCERCGQHFPVKPSLADTRRFCGKECENEWRSDYYEGENHPRWEDDPQELYYGPSYPPQRQQALERDNYRCRVCGRHDNANKAEYGCGLNAHHIQKFREFDDHETANRLENLIMLCSACHQHVENNRLSVPAAVWHRTEAHKATASSANLAPPLRYYTQ